MPIKDYDGTSTYNIGKFYDDDGSTLHQLSKVYDYDGTTNYLIYTSNAPESPNILTNGLDAQSAITGGWGINKAGSYWYYAEYDSSTNSIRFAQTNRSGHQWAYAYTNKKVAISGYSKLRVTYNAIRGYGGATACSGYITLCLTNTLLNPMPTNGVLDSSIVKGTQAYHVQNASDQTLDLDISGVDGSYYIEASQRAYASAETFQLQIKNIYFVE